MWIENNVYYINIYIYKFNLFSYKNIYINKKIIIKIY